jgi:predicted Zn finger-like uncharacterized protein
MSQKKNVHLARCPHCDSAFEVSNEELDLAFGAVRCGECMKIFNANFHRIDPPDAITEEPQESDSQAKDPIPTLHDHYHHQDTEETGSDDDEKEWMDEEMLAFEAELETALSDPDEPDEVSTDLLNEELVTESRDPQPQKKTNKTEQKLEHQGYRKYLVAVMVVLAATFSTLGAWLLWSPQTAEHFVVNEVSISPSNSPRMMEVRFQLSNQSQEARAIPDLQIDLLNLSRQVIATQKVATKDIQTESSQLEAGKSQMLFVEVERPSTYVQHARITPLTP